MKRTVVILLIMAGTFAHGAGGGSSVIHVDPAATGTEDGSDWANAVTNLAAGIALVEAGRMDIWVTTNTTVYADTLSVPAGVRIYGGFCGTESALSERAGGLRSKTGRLSVSLSSATTNVLDQLSVDGSQTERGTFKCINVSGNGTIVVSDCEMRNGRGDQYDNNGVAFHANNSCTAMLTNSLITECFYEYNDGSGRMVRMSNGGSLSMVDCCVSNNWNQNYYPSDNTGFVWMNSGICRLERTSFIKNTVAAEGSGGSIVYITGSCQATIRNCLFAKNTQRRTDADDYGNYGVGVYITNSSESVISVVENCTFADNTQYSSNSPCAIGVSVGTLAVTNNIFWNNKVPADGGKGGALYVGTAHGWILADYNAYTNDSEATIYDATAGGHISVGTHNLFPVDPLFVDAANRDYHLKSEAGHYTAGGWVEDAQTSPCVDAGDPLSDFSREPSYNGECINLGAYGGTEQASLTLAGGTVFMFK